MTATHYAESVFDWAGWLQLNMPDAIPVHGMEDEWLVLCPFHGDRNPSCAVNTKKAVFVCRSCGVKGSMRALREKVGGQAPDVSVSAAVLRERLYGVLAAKPELPRYVDSWLERYSPDNGYWRDVRGLLPSTIERYNLRYDAVLHEAIIPVYWQGELRGVIRRRLGIPKKDANGLPLPKYKFPKNLPRRELLWGYDEASEQKPRGPIVRSRWFGANPVVVTEGQVDAISVSETGVRAVGLGGIMLMKTQRLHLRRLSPTAVIIGLDNDVAGRGRPRLNREKGPTGVHQVAMMCGPWVPVFVVNWADYKDPGDVRDRVERTELVQAALPYREWRRAQ